MGDVEENPEFTDPSFTFSVDEDAAYGTLVDTVTATDPQNDLYSYSLSGTGSDLFSIDGSGTINVTGTLDYETASSYSLTATVYDMMGYYDTASVTINVNDINQPPVFDSPSHYFEASGTEEDLLIYLGTVHADDPEGLPVTYSLRAGFEQQFLLEQDGRLFFIGPDEPREAIYSLTLDAADPAGNIGSADVSVNLTLVAAPNLPPEITNNPEEFFQIPENAANGTAVGTITATDPNNDQIFFSIIAGNTGGAFSIDDNGVVKVADSTKLDYDQGTNPYTLTIQASDGELTDTYEMKIFLEDVNEAPTLEQNKQFTIAEDVPVNTLVGKIHAEDPDTFVGGPESNVSTELNYEIIEGDDAGVFRLEGDHDRKTDIKLVVDQPLDFETKSQYVLKIKVWDNGDPSLSATATVIVNVTDVGPPVVLNSSATIDENSPIGTLVGQPLPVTMEGQPTNHVTWAITGGDPNSVFQIDTNTGQVSVALPVLDADGGNNSFTLEITATSKSNPAFSDTGELRISVENVNEPPYFHALPLGPNQEPLYKVAVPYRVESGDDPKPVSVVQVQATDPEGQAVTYAIVGGNGDGAYTIDASTGQITLKADASPVVSTTTLQVQASDPQGLTSIALVQIATQSVIGITGDTHAVETVQGGYQDTITITFIRYADQPNIDTTRLTVSYTVQWSSATAADLANSQVLTGTITFEMGESRKSIELEAAQDLQLEGIELFTIQVQASNDYTIVPDSGEMDKKKSGRTSHPYLICSILDGVTLFGKMDQTQIALLQQNQQNPPNQQHAIVGVDDVDYNGILEEADYEHDNPGIHLNDLNQNQLGDCWFLAGVGAVAVQDWQQIYDRFTDNQDGTYTVNLFNQESSEWEDFTVSAELIRGYNMSDLSGDLDDRGYAEIWTLVLEAAMAQMIGWEEMHGGTCDEVFVALLGEDPSSFETIDTNDNNTEIVVKINNARGSGQSTVVLSTPDTFPLPSDPEEFESTVNGTVYTLHHDHGYVITGVVLDSQNHAVGYELYNPHGTSTKVSFDELNKVFNGFYQIDI